MKLNDSACPGCGQTIHRNHTCRRAPVLPLSPQQRAIEEALEAEARARCWAVLREAEDRRAGRVASQDVLVEVTP